MFCYLLTLLFILLSAPVCVTSHSVSIHAVEGHAISLLLRLNRYLKSVLRWIDFRRSLHNVKTLAQQSVFWPRTMEENSNLSTISQKDGARDRLIIDLERMCIPFGRSNVFLLLSKRFFFIIATLSITGYSILSWSAEKELISEPIQPSYMDNSNTPIKKSSAISIDSYIPTAPFLGNQLAIDGAKVGVQNASTPIALLFRENNCSLTLNKFTIANDIKTIVTSIPIPNTNAYLHNLYGLNSVPANFPNGCDNRTLGTPSAPIAFFGKNSNGEVLAATTLFSGGTSGYTLTLGRINTTKPSITTTELAMGVAETFAVADLNGDNIADIVTPFITANNQSGIGVFLSNADGSFKPVSIFSTDFGVYSSHRISIDDINADSKLDIVSMGAVDFSSSPKLSTFLGNGDGTFQVGPSLTATQAHFFYVAAFAIADFNGDSKKDVLTANGYWLQGNGDGSFQPSAQRLNAVLDQRNLAVGDFNGDSKLDVATTSNPNGGSPIISIYTGNGDGHFTLGASYAGARGADYLTSTDINGDGYTDIHVGLSGSGIFLSDVSSQGVGVMQFLFGHGDGTFIGAQALSGASVSYINLGVSRFALADFRGTGFPSIISLDTTADSPSRPTELNLRTASANGQFGAPSKIATLDFPLRMLTAGDLNGDGKPDIIADGWTRAGLGNGKFADPQNYTLPSGPNSFGSLTNLAAGDFNGDRRADIVVSMGGQNAADGGIYVYFTNPDGSLNAPVKIDGALNARQLATGDLNGDARTDLAISGFDPQFYSKEKLSGIRVYLGNADGSFSAPLNLSPTLNFSALAIADMNKDQKTDLVAGSYDAGLNSSVEVFPGLGDGNLAAAKTLALAGGGPGVIAALAVADFTADGTPDVMIAGQDSTEVLGGNGDGTLTGENALIIAGGADYLVTTDLNKDTMPDVVASVKGQGIVPLLRVKSVINPTPTDLPKADLAVTLSGTKKAKVGENLSYTITVKNKSKVVIPAVTVNSELPDSTTLVSKPKYCSLVEHQLSCAVGKLGKSASKLIAIKVKTAAYGVITQTTRVSSDSIEDTDPVNNVASTSTTVTNLNLPDLSIILSGTKNVKVGQNVSYTIRAINNANLVIPAVKVISELPDSTTLESKPNYCSLVAQQLTCDVGTLGKKKSKLISVKVKATASGVITHSVRISSDSINDINPLNNTALSSTTVTNVRVVK